MARYSKSFKSNVLRSILPPLSRDLAVVSQETGVSVATLHAWLQQSGGASVTTSDSERLSGSEKLRVLVETASLNEFELGEYCRRHGFYAEAVQRWRLTAISAIEPSGALKSKGPRREDRVQRKRILELEADLDRKNRALAEASALLVLEKKVREIWGAKAV